MIIVPPLFNHIVFSHIGTLGREHVLAAVAVFYPGHQQAYDPFLVVFPYLHDPGAKPGIPLFHPVCRLFGRRFGYALMVQQFKLVVKFQDEIGVDGFLFLLPEPFPKKGYGLYFNMLFG